MRLFQVELNVIDPKKGPLHYCLSIRANKSTDAYAEALRTAIDREQSINHVEIWFHPDISLDEVI